MADQAALNFKTPPAVIPSPLQTKSDPVLPAAAPDIAKQRLEAIKDLKGDSVEKKTAAIKFLAKPEVADKQSIELLARTLGSDNHALRSTAETALRSLVTESAKSPAARHVVSDTLDKLIDTYGRNHTNDDIRARLSARVVIQDSLYELGKDSANKELIAPAIRRLTGYVINGPEKYQGLSEAAVSMAVFNQTFDDNRTRVFNMGPGFETRRSLPELITEGFMLAALSSRKDATFKAAAERIAGLSATMPEQRFAIETRAQTVMVTADISADKGMKKAAPKLIAALSAAGVRAEPVLRASAAVDGPTLAANRRPGEQAAIPQSEGGSN